MIEANKRAVGPAKAFHERVARMFKDADIKNAIERVVACVQGRPRLPENAATDIADFIMLFMGPPHLTAGR